MHINENVFREADLGSYSDLHLAHTQKIYLEHPNMGDLAPSAQIVDAIAKYGLSERAAHNSLQPLPWDAVEDMLPKLWRSDNPNGL